MLLINVGLFFVARYALQPSDKLKADLRQSVQHYMKVDAVLRMDKIQTSMMVWRNSKRTFLWNYSHFCDL